MCLSKDKSFLYGKQHCAIQHSLLTTGSMALTSLNMYTGGIRPGLLCFSMRS